MKKPVIAFLCLFTLFLDVGIAGTFSILPANSSAAMMERLEHAHWIAAGAKSSDRVVYVFSDPNCPYCNDLWKVLRTTRAPDVQIRYLLVAVIDDDSRGKDGAILESKDPLASLDQHEHDFDNGGIAPKAKLQKDTQEIIASNEHLMSALGILGTPGLVYRNAHNDVVVVAGMPDQGQIKSIVGKR